MLKADIILSGGTVLTMDEDYTSYSPGAVVVSGDSIVAVGSAQEIATQYESEQVVDCSGQVIIPGLVNAHTHAAMSLLRGLADDLRLDVWLMGYIMPTEREFVNPEFVALGTSLSCAEMIASGITTFADMYYFEDSVAEATVKAGMRALAGHSVLRFPTPDAISYEESIAKARDFIINWKDHDLITPSIAPHAPYTSTDEMIQACTELALEFDIPLQMHIAEMSLEQEDSRSEHGMSVVPWLAQYGMFQAKVLAAHCVHVDDADIRYLKQHGTGAAHCPTSNLKLASGIAPVSRMLAQGLNVGIGTDGPASNNDLDMLEETRLAAILAKTASNNPRSLPAREALAMATRIGAKAIHLDHLVGTLEDGKRADIAVVDLKSIHNRPKFQRDEDAVYSQLVYAAKSTDVRHVMCNGAWLLRDGQHQTLQPDVMADTADDIARSIDSFLIQREESVLSKLVAIGGVAQEESFEVQVKVRLKDHNPNAHVQRLLDLAQGNVVKTSHYRQYDTYFLFGRDDASRLRYREDDFINADGDVLDVRTRLTLTGPQKEHEFEQDIVLSRSRFIAPAESPLRFYREYFQPHSEHEIVKERRRWHIDYREMRFYINLDRISEPAMEEHHYLEIKSRTWSLADAEKKKAIIVKMLEALDQEKVTLVAEEYVDMVI